MSNLRKSTRGAFENRKGAQGFYSDQNQGVSIWTFFGGLGPSLGEKMRLNTDVLSKLRVRKAKGGDEPSVKKKPRLTRKSKEFDPLTFVDSGIVGDHSTPTVEQENTDKVGATPEKQGDDAEILETEARGDTKGKSIEGPSILRDPHEALSKLTEFPFVADMRAVDKMSNKELSEKNLVATSQVKPHWPSPIRILFV